MPEERTMCAFRTCLGDIPLGCFLRALDIGLWSLFGRSS